MGLELIKDSFGGSIVFYDGAEVGELYGRLLVFLQ
jgi:hypothetical protein